MLIKAVAPQSSVQYATIVYSKCGSMFLDISAKDRTFAHLSPIRHIMFLIPWKRMEDRKTEQKLYIISFIVLIVRVYFRNQSILQCCTKGFSKNVCQFSLKFFWNLSWICQVLLYCETYKDLGSTFDHPVARAFLLCRTFKTCSIFQVLKRFWSLSFQTWFSLNPYTNVHSL